MGFQPPITVADAMAEIHNRRYVLPAIQREFVWQPEQICTLFDSLLRGYPIGSFLFWSMTPEQTRQFKFYEFLTDYHERDQPYASVARGLDGRDVTAVLDGQQRLTALNIGLHGRFADKAKRKWASNPDAYPWRRLYLDLSRDADPASGTGARYRFEFLADEATKDHPGWFRVSDIMNFEDDAAPEIYDWLIDHGFAGDKLANRRLNALYAAVRTRLSLNAYVEKQSDLDRVLDIFVRVNSQGTVLSHSDLLLSMATNQWKELDAREEIRGLVSELNRNDRSIGISKDTILKSGLLVTDIPDVGFKVSNFTQANMEKMEQSWPDIRSAVSLTVRLLADFGFTADTLRVTSIVLPLAYYAHHNQLSDDYRTAPKFADDREVVRSWVNRAALKRNVWGVGLDSLLSRLRDTIRTSPAGSGFPDAAIEATMRSMGRSLLFLDDEIEELVDIKSSNARTFATLALLYPSLDLTHHFHIDHVFPKSQFTSAKLRKNGIDTAQIADYVDKVDRLPNLQLLEGLVNISKQAAWPWDWVRTTYHDDAKREHYLTENDLHPCPERLEDFLTFYAARRDALLTRLRGLLGGNTT